MNYRSRRAPIRVRAMANWSRPKLPMAKAAACPSPGSAAVSAISPTSATSRSSPFTSTAYRTAFPSAVIAESERLKPFPPGRRSDLRHLPLITIDPPDARDHDDAVWAAPDLATGGVDVIVAIADVAHYVQPGTALDREARLRGNSVYFPDRVVPMLPERISNDLCSLREKEERPALACFMHFDKAGRKTKHRFERVIMRSAAKLSYEEAQAAIDGRPNAKTEMLCRVRAPAPVERL